MIGIDDPALKPTAWTSGLPDIALINAKLRAGITRRAYWQCRFFGGKVISEYESCCPKHKTFDWPELTRRGRVAIRLVAPNGNHAVLCDNRDATDRIFQFKRATLTAGVGRATHAHVIGLITDTAGNCSCVAWLPEPGIFHGFRDNVWNMQFDNTGRLGFDVLGIKPD